MNQGMVGADVAELRALAQRFDAGAVQLQQLAGKVRSQIQIAAWNGPRASRFRAEWDTQHATALRRVASGLSAQAGRLRQEASQQETASASNGRSSGASNWFSPNRVPSVLDIFDRAHDRAPWAFGALGLLGGVAHLADHPYLVGRYTQRATALAEKTGFRFKRVFNQVIRNGKVIEHNPLFRKIDPLVTVGDVASDLRRIGTATTVGGRVDSSVSLVEHGLKASKVGYLPGMALSSVHVAVDSWKEADPKWSDLGVISDAVKRDGFTDIVVGGAGDGLKTFFSKKIWQVF